jgi:hypothetical protein
MQLVYTVVNTCWGSGSFDGCEWKMGGGAWFPGKGLIEEIKISGSVPHFAHFGSLTPMFVLKSNFPLNCMVMLRS